MCIHTGIQEPYTTFKTLKANVFIGYNNPDDFSQRKLFAYLYIYMYTERGLLYNKTNGK